MRAEPIVDWQATVILGLFVGILFGALLPSFNTPSPNLCPNQLKECETQLPQPENICGKQLDGSEIIGYRFYTKETTIEVGCTTTEAPEAQGYREGGSP